MIDQKGKLFSRVSVIDLIILLILAISIGGVCYKLASSSEAVAIKADTAFEVVLRVNNVRSYTIDAIQVNDEVYEQHASLVGTVTAVDARPAKTLVSLADGTQVYGEVEGRCDVDVTLHCVGRVNDSGYFIGANRLVAPGGTINIQSQRVQCDAVVVSVGPALE